MDLSPYRQLAIFSPLDDDQLKSFLEGCEELGLSAGQIFIEQGTRGSCLYFVAEGRLKVFVQEEGGDERELAVIDAPAVVGEMEFLTGEPRVANVRALANSRAVELTYERLVECLEERDPATLQVLFRIAQVIARRLAAMDRKFAELEHHAPGTRFDELRDFQRKLMRDWTF
jgi:CRP-like cAMP-binding protein